ncbi:MAG: deoxyhypusine synthase [Nitrososphaerales archaeon]
MHVSNETFQGKEIQLMKISEKMSIIDLIEVFNKSGAYNAGRLAKGCKIYEKMLDNNATIGLTLAGALTPAGMGSAISTLIEKGLVDFIISTGANIYHDLHFALGLPLYQGYPEVNDEKLLREEISRIYDVFISHNVMKETDKFLRDIYRSKKIDKPISTAELHKIIGEALWEKAKYPERSFLANAVKNDVPVYTPAFGDSSIGLNLAEVSLRDKSILIDPNLDVIETTAIVFNSEKNGAIILGGGAPKNFYLQTQPMLSQILGRTLKGHDYFIQITTDVPQYGGLSGATPYEAVSWGKVDPASLENCVVIHADVTIAAPILFAYIISTKREREKRRLYLKREEFIMNLKKYFLK